MNTKIIAPALLAVALAACQAEPEQVTATAPAPAQKSDDGWRIAAGNLAPGVKLYFGQHDKIYRGQVMGFAQTDRGEAAVLMKDGQTEMMLRKDIAVRDFWVKAD